MFGAPCGGGSSSGWPQQPGAGYPQGGGQLQPFGGGRDPWGQMDGGMMMSPFGMMGGGGLFGSMFGQMDQMMRDMNGMMMGQGGSMQGMGGQGGSGMMMMGSSAGGGGGYSCQTMTFSSTMGQDGQMRTERFSSSSVGDVNGQMREVQQAYSNSGTGTSKMSLERQLEGRGRKSVKEHSAVTGEERQTDMYKGMSEEQYGQFEQDWRSRAVPRLPPHAAQGMQPAVLNAPGTSGSASASGSARGGYVAAPRGQPGQFRQVVQPQIAIRSSPYQQQQQQQQPQQYQQQQTWWR